MGFFDNIDAKTKIIKIDASSPRDILPVYNNPRTKSLFECEHGNIMIFRQNLIKSMLMKYAESLQRINGILHASSEGQVNLWTIYNDLVDTDAQINLTKTFIMSFVKNYDIYIKEQHTPEEMKDIISKNPPEIKAFTCICTHELGDACQNCLFSEVNKTTKINMFRICDYINCVPSQQQHYYFKFI